MNKKLLSLLLAFVLLVAWIPVSALATEFEETMKPTGFALKSHNKTGYVNEELGTLNLLEFEFKPKGAEEAVSFTSSDPTVVSVQYDSYYEMGYLQYHKTGTAIITATTASGLTDTCTVTVKQKESIQADESITVTVQPHDEIWYEFYPQETASYTIYSEEGTGALSLSYRDSAYYGLGAYTRELQASDTQACVAVIENMTDKPETYTVCVKKTVAMERIVLEQDYYEGYPGDLFSIPHKRFPIWSWSERCTYTSSDESVVRVEDSFIWLANPGTAVITLTSENGITADCMIKVLEPETISAGESKTVTLSKGEETYFVFTPETDGEYLIYTPSNGEYIPVEAANGQIYYYQEQLDIFVCTEYEYINSRVHYDVCTSYSTSDYYTKALNMKAGESYVILVSCPSEIKDGITGTVYLDKNEKPRSIKIERPGRDSVTFVGEVVKLICKGDGKLPFVTGNTTWEIDDEELGEYFGSSGNSASFYAWKPGTAEVSVTLDNELTASYTVTVVDPIQYDVIKGHGATVVLGGKKDLQITVDAPFEKFANYIEIDKKALESKNYAVEEDSTAVTLHADYLNTLQPGYHSVEVWFTDGMASLMIEVKEGTPENTTPVRAYGNNRYDTAFKAADSLKEQLGIQKFDCIVVACGDNFPDALSGTYLAAVKKAPMLLVRNNKATIQQVKDYINANLKSGGRLYLLGDSAVVPTSMEQGYSGITVKRLGGSTRYDTNLLILKEAGVGDQDILVCTGKGFADSLSASAVGKPILLVKDSLTDAQQEFLKGTAGKKYIIGGTSAVNTRIENALKTYGSVERLGGATRYDTSVLVAQEFFEKPVAMVLAYAQNFPDGLSGGPLAYAMEAPLILTANGKDASAAKYARELGIKDGFILGGPTLISDKTGKNIFSAETITVK